MLTEQQEATARRWAESDTAHHKLERRRMLAGACALFGGALIAAAWLDGTRGAVELRGLATFAVVAAAGWWWYQKHEVAELLQQKGEVEKELHDIGLRPVDADLVVIDKEGRWHALRAELFDSWRRR